MILQNNDQTDKYELTVIHLKEAVDDKGLLHEAIRDGDVERVKLLLGFGADVNATWPYGYNSYNPYREIPIHYAAKLGQIEIVKILLQHGSDVNAVDSPGKTPLHAAAENGYLEIAKLLLQNGADVDARDNHHFTPFHDAISLDINATKIVDLLLQNGADVNAKTIMDTLHCGPKY